MFIQPYRSDELAFAYLYHVFYRWQTTRRRAIHELNSLKEDTFQKIVDEFQIRLLEFKVSSTELLCLLSLRPTDSVSAVAGKLKGRLSRWISTQLPSAAAQKHLKTGYFACTSGKNRAADVEQYLENQSAHHDYESRPLPPVFVQQWSDYDAERIDLQAAHAATVLQYHLVLATEYRHGVFSTAAGEAISQCWKMLEPKRKFWLRKIAVLPDHIHLAVRLQPTLSPATLVVDLMNSAQELIFEEFSELAIRGKVTRLFQPSAYIGSFGELVTAELHRYVKIWQNTG